MPSVKHRSHDEPHRCPSRCSSHRLQAQPHAAAYEAMGLMISHQREPSASSLPAPGGSFPKEGGVVIVSYSS